MDPGLLGVWNVNVGGMALNDTAYLKLLKLLNSPGERDKVHRPAFKRDRVLKLVGKLLTYHFIARASVSGPGAANTGKSSPRLGEVSRSGLTGTAGPASPRDGLVFQVASSSSKLELSLLRLKFSFPFRAYKLVPALKASFNDVA
ncbi:hypothetical protein L0F63_003791 [Massospora cicadina]|nr:hypothetical protein L0F63_003791 [Massospora cicadina]